MKLRFTVAFDEADGEGIVFFGNYYRLAHRAFEAWLPRQGFTWDEWFRNPEFGVPLVHTEADYLKPLRPGDAYDVEIQVAKVGESSVEFTYLLSAPEGTALARLKTVHVFASRPEMRKRSIPPAIKDRLLALVRG